MGNTVKISFSAVTHIGSSYTVNSDRIFANGRFLRPSAADYAQISLESVDTKFLFTLSGNMEDDESGISLMNDLKRFYQKALSSSKDINVKLDELVQCVEQSSNLIHSLSLGEGDFGDKKPSFAGILIDEGSIAAVNLGSCRIYKLEGDTFKLLVNDYKRAERLLKMGIISSEQAEQLSSQQKASLEEGRTTVKKSDVNPVRAGITYLICSNGLTDSVNEDQIYDILSSSNGVDEAAAELVEQAVAGGPEENVTAMVIRISEAGEQRAETPGPRTVQLRSVSGGSKARPVYKAKTAARRQSSVDIGKIVSLVVLVFLATAVIFGGYKLWESIRSQAKETSGTGDTNKVTDGTDPNEPSSSITDDDEDADIPDDGTSAGQTDTDGTDGEEGNEDQADPEIGSEGNKYVVKPGDMLMLIAKRFYGDENKYKLIMEANDIKDPNKISVGQELIIPPDK
jgi:serine/threonine protein phosphatase PrpC/LysM repeat protein